MIDALDAYLANVPRNVYIPLVEYDTEIEFDQLTESFVRSLDALQPTGFGNPAPVMRARSAYLAQMQAVGLNRAHLQVLLSESGVRRRGIMFGAGELVRTLPATVDVLFTPEVETFKGRNSVGLKLRAITPGDPREQIDGKKEDECELQRDFLTEMLYNKEIIPSNPPKEIDLDALREMLLERSQGTLILVGDLGGMEKLVRALEDILPDPVFPRGAEGSAAVPFDARLSARADRRALAACGVRRRAAGGQRSGGRGDVHIPAAPEMAGGIAGSGGLAGGIQGHPLCAGSGDPAGRLRISGSCAEPDGEYVVYERGGLHDRNEGAGAD